MIFDLLWLDGHSLMALPYAERRARLSELALSGESWQTPEHVVGDGRALLRASVEQRLEGIVAKRLDSAYVPGQRAGSWIKIKTMGRQEFVIARLAARARAGAARRSARCCSASTSPTARCATSGAWAPASATRS